MGNSTGIKEFGTLCHFPTLKQVSTDNNNEKKIDFTHFITEKQILEQICRFLKV